MAWEIGTASIRASLMVAILHTFSLYNGASLIALIAALARLAYTKETISFCLFGRFFTMSIAITMLVVHIGKAHDWDGELVIIVSGFCAFLCRELLELVMLSKDTILKHIAGILK